MSVNKQLMDPIYFHIILVNGVHQLFGYHHSSKKSYFVFS